MKHIINTLPADVGEGREWNDLHISERHLHNKVKNPLAMLCTGGYQTYQQSHWTGWTSGNTLSLTRFSDWISAGTQPNLAGFIRVFKVPLCKFPKSTLIESFQIFSNSLFILLSTLQGLRTEIVVKWPTISIRLYWLKCFVSFSVPPSNSCRVPIFGERFYLAHPLHHSSYLQTLYSPEIESVVKQPTKTHRIFVW
jgi:hypothetical protein